MPYAEEGTLYKHAVKEGKVAGIRRAAELLVQWGATARESGDEFEGKCNEEAAESLRQIADRLEEEAGALLTEVENGGGDV